MQPILSTRHKNNSTTGLIQRAQEIAVNGVSYSIHQKRRHGISELVPGLVIVSVKPERLRETLQDLCLFAREPPLLSFDRGLPAHVRFPERQARPVESVPLPLDQAGPEPAPVLDPAVLADCIPN